MTEGVERARAVFTRHGWSEAFAALAGSPERGSFDAADHERLAVCAYLIGEDEECARAWEAAHRAALAVGDQVESARYAFWLAFCLLLRGQMAQAGGWLTRTEHLVAEAEHDCAAAGYLLVPGLLHALNAGDPSAARDMAIAATESGERFGDADLRAFGIIGHGQALIAMGDAAGGMARLDSVMVSVTSGEVGPITSGIVYCAVIGECMKVFDLQRASEWTDALTAWVNAQPDLVPYRGQCLIHRSQLQQAAGHWPDAITMAENACRRLTNPPHPALGQAYYQEGELHRLVGAFADAEAEYRQASRHGHHPMPGLALLELARGDAAAAAATIRRALEETGAGLPQPALLSAAVDILGAAGELSGARAAAAELAEIAAASTSPVLAAMAAQANGSVLVAENDPAPALIELRAAATAWQAQRMPYQAARTAVLLGLACSALGDRTAAALEFDNARDTFRELAAGPDLDHLTSVVDGLRAEAAAQTNDSSALSAREREVLTHVAAGRTNREIAALLMISQHTVARHVENIFAKLGVTTRAAAIAHAYQHGLF